VIRIHQRYRRTDRRTSYDGNTVPCYSMGR